MSPEVVTQGVRIRHAGLANPKGFPTHGRILQCGPPETFPVFPPTSRDHVVDGGKSEVLMCQMSVQHSFSALSPFRQSCLRGSESRPWLSPKTRVKGSRNKSVSLIALPKEQYAPEDMANRSLVSAVWISLDSMGALYCIRRIGSPANVNRSPLPGRDARRSGASDEWSGAIRGQRPKPKHPHLRRGSRRGYAIIAVHCTVPLQIRGNIKN
jgi:hypothetical protein